MRIPLQTKAPDQIDQRQCLAPGIEIVVLPCMDEPGEHLMTPFDVKAMAFSNVQPLQGLVDTTAAY